MESTRMVIKSENLYKTYWLYMRLLGVEGEYPFRWLLDLTMFFFVTLWFPMHLLLGIYNQPVANVLKSLHFTTECIFCTFKFVCFRWKLAEIKAIKRLLQELDKRAESDEERIHFNQGPRREAQMISKSYLVAAISAIITATAAGLFSSGRKLMYLGWFPYDVQASALSFWISFTYQAVGSSLLIVHNLANAIYPPITFCVVTGHVRLLAMRLSRIGHDEKISKADSARQLFEGIQDHRKLMQIIRLLRSTLFFTQLGQFLSSGINISITLVNILFFAENNFAMTYYSVFFAAMFIELFPSCYYGTLMSMEFDKLPYAIFSSNWVGMDSGYIRSLIILMELAVVPVNIKAGGIVGIDMNAFFSTVKMSYSFFTLAMSFRF
ncbi:odorant receptor 33a-like [Drosophila gunungcola]|uniref:odorant receptor 33a-like n=1 Tax=Drosophila gunungcola TaxID=103775 RepID=UPI0022E07530|nr:odorant receptor 33a-like [Drosophila gunungcola]